MIPLSHLPLALFPNFAYNIYVLVVVINSTTRILGAHYIKYATYTTSE
jgi:hypothetical protein